MEYCVCTCKQHNHVKNLYHQTTLQHTCASAVLIGLSDCEAEGPSVVSVGWPSGETEPLSVLAPCFGGIGLLIMSCLSWSQPLLSLSFFVGVLGIFLCEVGLGLVRVVLLCNCSTYKSRFLSDESSPASSSCSTMGDVEEGSAEIGVTPWVSVFSWSPLVLLEVTMLPFGRSLLSTAASCSSEGGVLVDVPSAVGDTEFCRCSLICYVMCGD